MFIDGPVDMPASFHHLERTERNPRLGAWPSYYLAVAELLMRDPDADAFLLVQDDAVFAAGFDVRTYLERILWPGNRPGIVSLLCPQPYTQSQPGWHPFIDDWVCGAQAFAFSREAAQSFLADSAVVSHRFERERNPLADIDWCVGQWASRHKRPIYYPTPSLVQHIGQISSLWQGRRAWGSRRASWLARKHQDDSSNEVLVGSLVGDQPGFGKLFCRQLVQPAEEIVPAPVLVLDRIQRRQAHDAKPDG